MINDIPKCYIIKLDMSFLKLEDFRAMFEEIMEWVYYEQEEDRGH